MSVQKIRAVAGLQRHIREFVETELRGVVSVSQLIFRKLEKEDKIAGRRQGFRERLEVDFGSFALVVESPVEKPPLGHITLFDRDSGEEIDGVLDVATWKRVGDFVKSTIKEQNNGTRRHFG